MEFQCFRLGVEQRIHLGLDSDLSIALAAVDTFHVRSDLKRVAGEVHTRIGVDEVYVAVESSSGVPSAVLWLSCVGFHSQDVVLPEYHLLADVHVKSKISVVCAPYTFAVEIEVAHEHDAFHVHQDSATFE